MRTDEKEWMAGAPPRELWNRLNRECFLDTLPGYLEEHAELRPVEVTSWPGRSGTRTVYEVWVDGMHVIPAEHDHIYIYERGGDAERFDGGHCAEICRELYRMRGRKEMEETKEMTYRKVPEFIRVGDGDRSMDSRELARSTPFLDDRYARMREGFREWVDERFTPYRMMLMVLGQEEPVEFMLSLYIDHLAEMHDEDALFHQFGVRLVMVEVPVRRDEE